MVSLLSLWLPILASGVAVFVVSSVFHMVLKYHADDFRSLPAADAVQGALRPFAIPPGDSMLPRAGSMAEMSDPAFVAELTRGPVAIMTVLPNRPFALGRSLATWFAHTLVVGIFAAYLSGRALRPGGPRLAGALLARLAASFRTRHGGARSSTLPRLQLSLAVS